MEADWLIREPEGGTSWLIREPEGRNKFGADASPQSDNKTRMKRIAEERCECWQRQRSSPALRDEIK